MNTKPNLSYKTLDQYLAERYPTKQKRNRADERFLRLKLGYEIYLARKKKHLTQSELAKRLNTKQSVIARIETGEQNLTTEKLNEIAQVLDRELKIQFI